MRLAATLPTPPSSPYADEGTAQHELSELYARFLLLGKLTPEEFESAVAAWRIDHAHAIIDEYEMKTHARNYVELLRDIKAKMPDSVLLLEQRVPTGIPQCWGTGDAVFVSPTKITVVDLKYGKGVRVEAAGNPQLKLYGVGGLEAFGDMLGEVEEVEWIVYQPRLDHVDSDSMSAADLRAWRDSLLPVAEAALGPDAGFGPSEDACRWCPASGNCAAQTAFFTSMDFGDQPETLSVEDLADLLPRLDGIEAWCAAVRASALDRAYGQGETIPGYKVVRSSGKRYVANEAGAMEALYLLGVPQEVYATTKIKGIGELEKLGYIKTLRPFISKTEGKPSLAPESDNRDSITPDSDAALAFAEPHTDSTKDEA